MKQLDEETGEEFTYDRDEIVRLWNTGDEKKRTAMAKWYGGYLRLQQFVDTCQNEDWIENNSKPCPKCATAIEVFLNMQKAQKSISEEYGLQQDDMHKMSCKILLVM